MGQGVGEKSDYAALGYQMAGYLAELVEASEKIRVYAGASAMALYQGKHDHRSPGREDCEAEGRPSSGSDGGSGVAAGVSEQ